jgi:hypothetical protein
VADAVMLRPAGFGSRKLGLAGFAGGATTAGGSVAAGVDARPALDGVERRGPGVEAGSAGVVTTSAVAATGAVRVGSGGCDARGLMASREGAACGGDGRLRRSATAPPISRMSTMTPAGIRSRIEGRVGVAGDDGADSGSAVGSSRAVACGSASGMRVPHSRQWGLSLSSLNPHFGHTMTTQRR